MNAKEIIKKVYEKKDFFNLDWFAKALGIMPQEAIEIIRVGMQEGHFYETGINNEWALKSITEALYENSLEDLTAPRFEEHLKNFTDFLQKFFQNIDLKKTIDKFFDKRNLANQFLEIRPLFFDKNRIWWLWNKADYRWEMIDETDILNSLNEVVKTNTINSKERNEILESLRQEARKIKPDEPKDSWVQFKEKIYDLETKEILVASAKYFISNPIMWNIGNSNETPEMDKLIDSWVGEEHRQELYEILAFCIVPNYFIHRMFCLIGSGANGKSTFLKILEKFIGERNITSSSLYLLMKERFEGSKLLKKLVCLIGETNFNILNNTDFLKKLSGQDTIRCEFKGKDSFDFRNYAKLVMATNSLPPTGDKTEGFYRRWKIIDFPNKFDKEEDVLAKIPDSEYENLAFKCLEIIGRLWSDRTFSNDGTFDDRKKRYEDRANPLMLFIKENYVRDVNGSIVFADFKDEFNGFLIENGHRELNAIGISKQLRNEGFAVSQKTIKGKTTHWILGLENKVKEQGNLTEINENTPNG